MVAWAAGPVARRRFSVFLPGRAMAESIRELEALRRRGCQDCSYRRGQRRIDSSSQVRLDQDAEESRLERPRSHTAKIRQIRDV